MEAYYMTQYALTTGIHEFVGETDSDGWVRGKVRGDHGQGGGSLVFDPKFAFRFIHKTKNDAERNFYQQRERRVAALRRQIEKLMAMKPNFL
jgi:hypothetical protein